MLDRLWPWLRSIVLRGQPEREMQEEMNTHLARSTERPIVAPSRTPSSTNSLTIRLPGAPTAMRTAISRVRRPAESATTAYVGLGIGLPIGLAGLAGLHAFDASFPALPLGQVTVMAATAVLATATIAAWIPARRAAAVHLAVTLHAA